LAIGVVVAALSPAKLDWDIEEESPKGEEGDHRHIPRLWTLIDADGVRGKKLTSWPSLRMGSEKRRRRLGRPDGRGRSRS
jgi:hypothetical protein